MIDNELSHQLHSLAAIVNEPLDMAALHRRISNQSRRRSVAKVGFAGASVAAVVGGLIVVREERSSAPQTVVSGASPTVSGTEQSQLPALPGCTTVLAGMKAIPRDSVVEKDDSTAKSSRTDLPELDFKGTVTILTIDGSQITYHKDEVLGAQGAEGLAMLDAATVWNDGTTDVAQPQSLQVGQQIGLATTASDDGVDHAVFINVHADVAQPDETVVVPGPALLPGPTGKSIATITAADTTSITVTFDDDAGDTKTATIDLASTPFYAGDTVCQPETLTVGEDIGLAYHVDDAGNILSDAVMVMS